MTQKPHHPNINSHHLVLQNAPSKTPSTKDTSSSSIDYIPKSPTSFTSPSTNGYLNSPTSPPSRVPLPPPIKESGSIDITLTLSPITLLDVDCDDHYNPVIWSRKLDDALWAFRTAFKTSTGTTPYKLVYGKNCHMPFEIEHRAYWALKNCNPDLIAAGEKIMFQLHELDEIRHQAYENSRLYKARTKVWHDRKLKMRNEFKHRNKVLLFHSKYKFKQPKLRSRWLGPYVVKHQYPSRYVELYGKDGKTFIVNGHRLKLYHEEEYYNDQRESVTPFFLKE
ncbi:reverse transcriptase domain-containing protein [Tanacetum coccineum]